MALYKMVGQYSNNSRSHFTAMTIMIALPDSIVYLFVQHYFVSGLAIGGVKS